MKKEMVRRTFAGLLASAMMVMRTPCSGDSSPGAGSAGGNSAGGDSNFNESGWPVVNEKVTLKVYGSRNSDSLEDWNDYILLQEMEEKTNVDVYKRQDQGGTIGGFLLCAFVEMYRETKEEPYLQMAEKALRFYVERDLNGFFCTAGALDTTCIDKETSIPLILSSVELFSLCLLYTSRCV